MPSGADKKEQPRRLPAGLRAGQLRRRVAVSELRFATTAEVEPLEGTIGQPRALEAIEFGLEIGTAGYNLFVAGAPGSGRATTVRDYLERAAAGRPAPDDWIYVHNFAAPDRPNAIRLPAGDGAALARDMEEFLRAARREIPRAFESEDYENRRQELMRGVAQRRDALTGELQAFARERGFAIELTPVGIVSMPLADGNRPLKGEEFEALPPARRAEIEQRGREIQGRVASLMRQLHQLEKSATEQVRKLERDVATFATGPLFHDLRERHADAPEVLAYLDQVQDDLLDHIADFRGEEEEQQPKLPLGMAPPPANFARYRVNVLVDNGKAKGAPVVLERHPTYYNLTGRVEYRPAFGTMVTDFHQIKAGALHRANGGFLVLEARDVLLSPFSWDALKRALVSREVRIENLAEQYSPLPTATLRPEAVPLDVKVVLIGSPSLYQLLFQLEEEFPELFKVKVDFAPEMDWSPEHFASYAAFVARCVQTNGLRHFRRAAVARVIEHGARLREHQRKLSTRMLEISDVVSEASFWAGKAGRTLVAADDVARAIAERERRSSLVEERVHELIADGTVMIDVAGERVGQVNGLAVLDLGDHAFGRPSRVTARVSLGSGSVKSIEREIELSGPIHSKGFLILSGYLAASYAQEWPLSLAATITFEQSYGEIDGDSASSTELYALLSALSELPLRQGVAVTGSVNQYGRVQAVGGVTHKIEGFYAVCKSLGLTGEQGVIVPAANVPNLMLRDELVEAVRARRFHVWPVSTIDQGIALLTGRPAGRRRADGTFPPGTVHALALDRLRVYAERAREGDAVKPQQP